jgi:hypothetical protein
VLIVDTTGRRSTWHVRIPCSAHGSATAMISGRPSRPPQPSRDR